MQHVETADSEIAIYARAEEHCRGPVKRPMALDFDKRVLCFDGWVAREQNVSIARQLQENGLFVVRSYGGDIPTTIALADLLRDRRATVVIYDYCIYACADYLFIASDKTFVSTDTVVAWRHLLGGPNDCPFVKAASDGGPKRLMMQACPHSPPEYASQYARMSQANDDFYATRKIDRGFERPPQSFAIRKILTNRFEGRGVYPNIFWTWNPRYYTNSIRTKVVYEAYPQSRAELDAIFAKLRFGPTYRVIYDP